MPCAHDTGVVPLVARAGVNGGRARHAPARPASGAYWRQPASLAKNRSSAPRRPTWPTGHRLRRRSRLARARRSVTTLCVRLR
eukprot:1875479-Pleurochrysis_carterae.AAC.1